VVGLSLLIMGQTLPGKVYNVVKAKRFEVIGDNGRMMVMLTSDRDFGLIAVVNSKKNPLVSIGADNSGNGIIRTHNPKGKQLVYIGAAPHKSGLVKINNSAGKHLIRILSDKSGAGRIVQINRANKVNAIWPPLK